MLRVRIIRQFLLRSLFFLSLSMSAKALMVGGYELPDTITIDDDNVPITLQGASVRSWYAIVKGYIGALYLAEPSNDPEEIYRSDTHQQMAFVMLVSKMSARRIANVFYDAIQLNSPPEEQEEMKESLEVMMDLIDGSMKKGDRAIFEYLPGKGVRIEIAGIEKGLISTDKRLFNLILRVWIGETPPNKRFKSEILGLTPVG